MNSLSFVFGLATLVSLAQAQVAPHAALSKAKTAKLLLAESITCGAARKGVSRKGAPAFSLREPDSGTRPSNSTHLSGNPTRYKKGAPYGVGFECFAQPLQKGTPL